MENACYGQCDTPARFGTWTEKSIGFELEDGALRRCTLSIDSNLRMAWVCSLVMQACISLPETEKAPLPPPSR